MAARMTTAMRTTTTVRLGPAEAVAQRVADARFEGNVSLAIRHIIRQYAESERMAYEAETEPMMREDIGVVRE